MFSLTIYWTSIGVAADKNEWAEFGQPSVFVDSA